MGLASKGWAEAQPDAELVWDGARDDWSTGRDFPKHVAQSRQFLFFLPLSEGTFLGNELICL